MFAIVKVGGKQYRVEEGGRIVVDRLDAAEGKTVELNPLLVSDGKDVHLAGEGGNSKVTAEGLAQEDRLPFGPYAPRGEEDHGAGQEGRAGGIADGSQKRRRQFQERSRFQRSASWCQGVLR
jgi:hypothetical protein